MPVRCNKKVTYIRNRGFPFVSWVFVAVFLVFCLFVCLFLFCFVLRGGEGWFGSLSEKRRNEELNLLVVFRLFTVCSTRRFAQPFRRARYATGLFSSMQSYCE